MIVKMEREGKHIEQMEQLSDNDSIILVGNLMDNAIEAAEKCRDGFIKVFMFMKKSCFRRSLFCPIYNKGNIGKHSNT